MYTPKPSPATSYTTAVQSRLRIAPSSRHLLRQHNVDVANSAGRNFVAYFDFTSRQYRLLGSLSKTNPVAFAPMTFATPFIMARMIANPLPLSDVRYSAVSTWMYKHHPSLIGTRPSDSRQSSGSLVLNSNKRDLPASNVIFVARLIVA